MHETLTDLPLPFGTLHVRTFGVALSLGLLAGWYVLRASARARALPARTMEAGYALGVVLGLGLGKLADLALLGARGFTADAGFDVVGAGVGVATAVTFVALRARVSPMRVLDASAPVLALVALATRIGCQFAGCHAGVRLPASAPTLLARWGTFPRVLDGDRIVGSRVFLAQVEAELVAPTARHALPVHPAALYDAAIFALLLGLVAFASRGRTREGVVGVVFVLVASLGAASVDAFARQRTTPSLAVGVGMLVALALVARVVDLNERRALDAPP